MYSNAFFLGAYFVTIKLKFSKSLVCLHKISNVLWWLPVNFLTIMLKYVPNTGKWFHSNYLPAVTGLPYRFCAQVHFLAHLKFSKSWTFNLKVSLFPTWLVFGNPPYSPPTAQHWQVNKGTWTINITRRWYNESGNWAICHRKQLFSQPLQNWIPSLSTFCHFWKLSMVHVNIGHLPTHVLLPNSVPHPATCSVIEKTNTVILMSHNIVFQQHEKVVLLIEYFEFFH